ncbi:MAG: DUF1269 domain-containing protein [Maritimibacter sp.]|nr:DUF1269 domain-containing protein [Maritimibacter sp.]
MAELLVIGYDSYPAAEAARTELFQLSDGYYAEIDDAVVAMVDENGRVRLNQLVTPWQVGATSGSFWGLLIGLLFLHPLLGVLAGAATGAATGAVSDFGIRDSFVRDVAKVLKPKQAALFVLAREVQSDRIIEHLADHGGHVLRTNLSNADEDKLRAAYDAALKHAAPQAAE